MIDFYAPSSKRALAELDKEAVRRLVFKAAMWLAGSESLAEDLMANARNCVCDPTQGKPWDPARGRFSAHMRIVMRGLVNEERARARTWREVTASALPFDADAEDPNPQPDEALAEARCELRMRRLGRQLRERISHDAWALQVFDRMCETDERGKELAAAVGHPVEDVYAANRLIGYHAAKVLADERAAEARKMKELREQAKKKKETT